MAVETPPWSTQNSSFPANQTRRAVFFALNTNGGVKGTNDLLVSAPSSGMSVNVDTGEVIIPGSNTLQGVYYGCATSVTNLIIAASNSTNPRIDTICATVYDESYGAVADSWTVQVITGTPTAGATLQNLDGAAAIPVNSLLIAYVLVPANSTSIVSSDLLDERISATVSIASSNSGGEVAYVSRAAIGTANTYQNGATYTTPKQARYVAYVTFLVPSGGATVAAQVTYTMAANAETATIYPTGQGTVAQGAFSPTPLYVDCDAATAITIQVQSGSTSTIVTTSIAEV